MTLLGVWASFIIASTFYYAPTGPIELFPVHDKLALDVPTECFDRFRSTLRSPEVNSEVLWGDYRIIDALHSSPSVLKKLQSFCPSTKKLVAYRRFPNGQMYISDGKIRLKFKPDTSKQAIRSILDSHSLGDSRSISGNTLLSITVTTPSDVLKVVRSLMMRSEVQWATPDLIYKKKRMWAPNDSWLSLQWHHDLIGSQAAWQIERGRSEAIVAVLDSGVDMTHPDLATKLVFPYDSLENDFDPTPQRNDAHGTACAGVVGAVGDNEIGVVGVCPGCSIMPIRIMSENGWGRYGADADAIRWAVDNGAQVLSNSWGHSEPIEVPVNLEDAITYAATYARGGYGALLLFASGNDGRENYDYELPSHPLVVGVGATNYRDERQSYSNYGPQLDLVAPSASVTTDLQGTYGYSSGGYTAAFGGTSAAAPVAAGIAGLLVSVNLELNREQIAQMLTEATDPLEEFNEFFHDKVGFGRVNALRAVQIASGIEVCKPQFEDCTNEVDDDCDGLIDGDDSHCAPDVTGIGIPCVHDFECGIQASCLTPGWGFPGGYCTTSCDNEVCQESGSCSRFRGSEMCFASCDTRDDCREGYDCLAGTLGELLCMPSCTVLGCGPGERCDELSGDCYHDGPSIPGGACTDSLQCAMDGWCLREERFGISGGFCGVRCSIENPCPIDFQCVEMTYVSLCFELCEEESDCRSGFTCHPSEENPAVGICWESCVTSGCGDGEECNIYGLCGSDIPPNIYSQASQPNEQQGPVQACSCDLTTICDGDCSCDPECNQASGCSSAGMPTLWFAMMAWCGFRRRVQRKERL